MHCAPISHTSKFLFKYTPLLEVWAGSLKWDQSTFFIMLCLQFFITELLKVTVGHLLNCNGFSSWYIMRWKCIPNDWLNCLMDDFSWGYIMYDKPLFCVSFPNVQSQIFNILCNWENMFSVSCNFFDLDGFSQPFPKKLD